MEFVVGLVIVAALLSFAAQSSSPPRGKRKGGTARARPKTGPGGAPRRDAAPKLQIVDTKRTSVVPAPRGSKLSGRAWVIDGDTISIGRTKIRLAGIDAPEIDQPYGQKSKWEMVRICKGQRVTAVMHGETSYDRQVATVFLSDGRDAGAELVRRGLALDLAHFSGGKYRALEPEGARRRLCHGAFGHRSLRRTRPQA